MAKKKKLRSLGDKVSASTLNSAFSILVVAMIIMTVILSVLVLQVAKATMSNLAFTLAQQVDGEKMAEVAEVATGQYPSSVLANQYVRTLRLKIANTIKRYRDVKAAFFVVFDKEAGYHTYLFEVEPGGVEEQPGLVESTEAMFPKSVRSHINEDTIPAFYHTTNAYGPVILAAEPIHYNGVIVGYACVDMTLHQALKSVRTFIIIIFILLSIMCLINMQVVRNYYMKNLVKPINQIIDAAQEYIYEDVVDDDLELDSKHNSFQRLKIETGDELQQLASAMKNMEIDLGRYIEHLTKVTSEKQRMSTELSLATRIQAHMLPGIFPPFPDRDEFDLYATMDPAKEVGGDFYDFFMVDHDHLALVVADVSGKGIPAAMFLMISKIIIKNVTQNMVLEKKISPAEVLQKANSMLCENNEDEMFVTVWLGILNIPTGKLVYANAGHENPLLYKDKQWSFDNNRHGFVLAGMDGMRYKDYEVQLSPGDFLFQYTDGVTEATNPDNELFGDDRVMEVAKKAPLNVTEFLRDMRSNIDGFVKEAPQFDDITMLGLLYKGPGKHDSVELNIDAKVENLEKVLGFIDEQLEKNKCPMKTQMQIDVAVEELFVNVASYAYAPDSTGKVLIQFGIEKGKDSKMAVITFIDNGIPYNPLAKPDPDVSLSAEERNIGGLGVYMVKKSMDSMNYSHEGGSNRVTIKKRI